MPQTLSISWLKKSRWLVNLWAKLVWEKFTAFTSFKRAWHVKPSFFYGTFQLLKFCWWLQYTNKLAFNLFAICPHPTAHKHLFLTIERFLHLLCKITEEDSFFLFLRLVFHEAFYLFMSKNSWKQKFFYCVNFWHGRNKQISLKKYTLADSESTNAVKWSLLLTLKTEKLSNCANIFG